jgi:hypothetical protein
MGAQPQFSLRWIFVITAAAALIAGEAFAFAPPTALAVGVSISLLFFAALAAGLVYARDSARAFCVGALASLLATRFVGVPNVSPGLVLASVFYSVIPSWLATKYMNSYGIEYGLSWLFAIAGGFMAIVVRWLAVGRGGNAPPRSGEGI